MNNREELGLWGYVFLFLTLLVALVVSIKDLRNAYAGQNPLDLRHPWSKSPEGYIPPQAEAPATEYASSPESGTT